MFTLPPAAEPEDAPAPAASAPCAPAASSSVGTNHLLAVREHAREVERVGRRALGEASGSVDRILHARPLRQLAHARIGHRAAHVDHHRARLLGDRLLPFDGRAPFLLRALDNERIGGGRIEKRLSREHEHERRESRHAHEHGQARPAQMRLRTP